MRYESRAAKSTTCRQPHIGCRPMYSETETQISSISSRFLVQIRGGNARSQTSGQEAPSERTTEFRRGCFSSLARDSSSRNRWRMGLERNGTPRPANSSRLFPRRHLLRNDLLGNLRQGTSLFATPKYADYFLETFCFIVLGRIYFENLCDVTRIRQSCRH